MDVEAIPLTDFVHGRINAAEGKPIPIEKGVAEELEKAGLVRIKLSPLHANKMKFPLQNKESAGKAPDAGAGQPSSASPAAQVSPQQIANTLKIGGSKPKAR